MGLDRLDLWTAMLCILMCFALGVLHILTSPPHRRWITLPRYVRVGFFVTANGMLYRGVDLLVLARPPEASVAGHIDGAGFLLSISMAFTICGLAVHAYRNSYAPAIRRQVEHIEDLARDPAHGDALAQIQLDGGARAQVVGPHGRLPEA